MKKLSFFTPRELQQEKEKDYRNVTVVQIIIVTMGLTLSEWIITDADTFASKMVITLFSAFGALYAFLLWDMLRNFTSNRILKNAILITLTVISIFGILTEFPFYQIIEFPNRQLNLFIIHGLLFPIEVTIIGYALNDLFSGGNLTPDKLWGAACVFLMTGISFGSLYDLICIVKPGSFGIDLKLGIPNYAESVRYSFSILGGVEPGLPNASVLIRNLSVIEGVWGALYAMLIIGKLLGLPRAEENKS